MAVPCKNRCSVTTTKVPLVSPSWLLTCREPAACLLIDPNIGQGLVKLRPGPLNILQSAFRLPLSNVVHIVDTVVDRTESLL